MAQHLQSILHAPMNRKEFLRYSGILVFTVVGGFSLIKVFTDPTLFKRYPRQTTGYGSSNYGGVEKETS